MALTFEDDKDLPAGRRTLEVPDELMAALADSAKKKVAKARTETEQGVRDLRSLLNSAAVKAKYEVATECKALGEGKFRFKFSAAHKHDVTAK